MNKRKIFNDPVYGFISLEFDILLDLIDHPWFQRLRRIKQLGLTDYVYPGAIHTRFHHALGALHLMQEAIKSLRSKGVEITKEEAEGACIAILLHDIGHAPYSHALEGVISHHSHEQISSWFMAALNEEFDGRLAMAIEIFNGTYSKPFLHQLVTSQLDMDRLDYLTRDSFFTGVAEGVIGYDRILKMLTVVEDQLVVEEKGLHSIQRFLLSRHFMYSQVYLHKTVIAAEQMLKRLLLLYRDQLDRMPSSNLKSLWEEQNPTRSQFLNHFSQIDDIDIFYLLKGGVQSPWQSVYAYLSNGLVHRQLLKTQIFKHPIGEQEHQHLIRQLGRPPTEWTFDWQQVVIAGSEKSASYYDGEEINILVKAGNVQDLRSFHSALPYMEDREVHFICYPQFPKSQVDL